MTNNTARLNITFEGENGDLIDTIRADASDAEVIRWATEAVISGDVPGISARQAVNFDSFIVDRFPANEHRVEAIIQLRPKTPFG
jgi:hypothetical protein